MCSCLLGILLIMHYCLVAGKGPCCRGKSYNITEIAGDNIYSLSQVGTGESFGVPMTTGNTACAVGDEEKGIHFQNEDYIDSEACPPPDYDTLQISFENKAAEAGYEDDTADMDKMADEVSTF